MPKLERSFLGMEKKLFKMGILNLCGEKIEIEKQEKNG
jgi:Fe2+ transport system protein FeoA